MDKKAARHWSELDNKRRMLLTRWERYASYTIPRICLPSHFNEKSDELKHDWQAVGAQAVNHVVNKLMLALFAPSRPFMRLELTATARAQLAEQVDEAMIDDILGEGERKAMKQMDTRGDIRPALFLGLANLVITGNALFKFPENSKDKFRCLYCRDWAVQRSGSGDVLRLALREKYAFAELEDRVQEAYLSQRPGQKPDDEITHYVIILRNATGGYDLKQYINDCYIGAEFDGSYKDYAALPYKVITWQLADNADYGSGLVEDFAGDFAAISAMSEAQLKAAILACEFRWLVNPAGFTKPEDLEDSENGAALPGNEKDITPLTPGTGNNLQVIGNVMQDYIRRVGQGFLLASAVTRDAERVTAQEIRMQATELETSLGGAYTRIAVELQTPIAHWLLDEIDLKIDGKAISLSIVTGLDALSRSGDLDALRQALGDINSVNSLPPAAQEWLNLGAIYSTIMNGHGLPAGKYVKDEATVAQQRQAQQAAMQQQAINEASATAGAQAVAQQATEGQA